MMNTQHQEDVDMATRDILTSAARRALDAKAREDWDTYVQELERWGEAGGHRGWDEDRLPLYSLPPLTRSLYDAVKAWAELGTGETMPGG